MPIFKNNTGKLVSFNTGKVWFNVEPGCEIEIPSDFVPNAIANGLTNLGPIESKPKPLEPIKKKK